MATFEGEFAHPYVDVELNDPRMRSLVQSLIDKEKLQLPKPEAAVDPIRPPVYLEISLEDLPPAAQYEDLCNQERAIKLMLLRREEFWRNEIAELETLIKFSADRKSSLLEEIEAITKARQETQLSAAPRIRRLKDIERQLDLSIARIRSVIAAKSCPT
jgi:hypothetical protein